LRVLFWSATFLPYLGGVEVLGSRLLLALRDRGHELVVVTRQDSLDLPREDEYGGVRITRFPFRQALESRDPEQILAEQGRLASLKRDFRPDLTNIYHPGPDIYFHLATRPAVPAPEFAVLHIALPPDVLRPGSLFRRWLGASAWVAACSTSVLGETRQAAPEIVPRSSVLYGSLAPPRVAPRTPNRETPRLVCIGRVTPEKGFDVALEAFRSVLDRFPRARLTIAGDGPSRPALERRAAALGVADQVDFLGWVTLDRAFLLIHEATLVVMPSRREPFGLVAVQAAQMARPIVASRVGGLPEIVRHGETGLLVPRRATARRWPARSHGCWRTPRRPSGSAARHGAGWKSASCGSTTSRPMTSSVGPSPATAEEPVAPGADPRPMPGAASPRPGARPLVSCVVPTYNSERYLAEALDSILAQTYRPIEVIVADDGSTDRTLAIAAGREAGVRQVFQPTAGPSATRNLGVRAALGTFVAFLDADDLWHPEKLTRQMARFDARPELDLCVTYARNFWTEELSGEGERFREHARAKAVPGYASTTLLARRQAFVEIGDFDPALWFAAAAEWFVRARELGAVIEIIPETLVYHRMHRENVTRRHTAASRDEFLAFVKATLDRRRRGTPGHDAGR